MGIILCNKHGRSGICDVSETVRLAVYGDVPLVVSRFELTFDDENWGGIRFVWWVDDETRTELLRERLVVDGVIRARSEAEWEELLDSISVACAKCFGEYRVRHSSGAAPS